MTPRDSDRRPRRTTWHTVCVVTAVLARWSLGAPTADIATGDGLSLGLDATGAILHCQVDGRELLRPNAKGGFFLADVSALPGPDRELINNGSYEQVDAAPPVGWESGPEWTVDRQIAHTGTASMRVCIPGPDKRYSASLAQEVAARPNAPYQVMMWVRTEGGTPHLYVEQLDANGRQHPDYPQLTVSHARSRSDWFQLGTQFTTAPFCRRVRVRTNLWQQTGTAWIDDVSLICLEDDCLAPQRPVPGVTTVTAAGLEQQGELADAALRLSATYTQRPDHIIVAGEVADSTGRDRAVTVSFRLPVDAVGWTWYDDVHDRQPIEAGQRYGAARLMGGDGRRAVTLYPFAALNDARSALALAVPMDQPRAFRLCFDAELGFYVNYEFGLSQDTAKFPARPVSVSSSTASTRRGGSVQRRSATTRHTRSSSSSASRARIASAASLSPRNTLPRATLSRPMSTSTGTVGRACRHTAASCAKYCTTPSSSAGGAGPSASPRNRPPPGQRRTRRWPASVNSPRGNRPTMWPAAFSTASPSAAMADRNCTPTTSQNGAATTTSATPTRRSMDWAAAR